MSLAAVMVGALLLTVTGWSAASLVRVASPVGFLLAAYLTAWSALILMVLVVSFAGRISTGSLLAVGGVLAGLTLVARRLRAPLAPDPRRTIIAPFRQALAHPPVLVLAVALGAALGYVSLLGLATPPNDWDGLTYHLARAALWIQEDHVGYLPAANEPRLNGNPPASEIGMAALLALGRGDRYVTVLSLAALGAMVVGTAGLARRASLTHSEAILGGLAIATLPIVLLHGQAVMNDLVVASFLVAATYFLLGTGTAEGALAALALGLALATKFTAVLAIPVVALVVLVARAQDRGRAMVWLGVGVVLGSPWYILNVARTGHLDGGLAAETAQSADHSLRAVVSTFRALVVDLLDLSGLQGLAIVLYLLAGALIIVLGVLLGARRHDRRLHRECLAAGAIVILAPFAILQAPKLLVKVWWKAFHAVGRPDVARAGPASWDVSTVSDTSLSGYGSVGLIAVCVAVTLALGLARRARVSRRVAAAYAGAPFALMSVLALMIVWDPWRSRLEMFALAPPTALLGLSLRMRWASWAIVGLAVPTMALVLAVPLTKPSGLPVLESRRSIWGRDRIDAQTSLRFYEGTPALLRAVERFVPEDASLAAAVPMDTFLAPLFGESYRRTLLLVADRQAVPTAASWLVRGDGAQPRLRPADWRVVHRDDENGWKLLRRVER